MSPNRVPSGVICVGGLGECRARWPESRSSWRSVRREQSRSRARRVLERLSLLRLDDSLLDAAAQLDGSSLRSPDAIHIAAAQTIGVELESVVTYDIRMTAAAIGLGLRIASPS